MSQGVPATPDHLLTYEPLRRDQLAQFDADGFLVVRGVFGPAEVERMRQAFERLAERAQAVVEAARLAEPRGDELAQGVETKQMVDGSQFVVVPDAGRVRIPRVVWCGACEPDLLALGADRRLTAMAAQLLGSAAMDQLINQAHFKFPGDGVAFSWHQDSRHRRWGTELWTDVNGRGSFIETTTAVDAMTADNGPLQFIPGSHRGGHIALDPHTGELPADAFDPDLAVTVPLEPGDVALFGPYVIHGSQPNRGTSPRRLFLNGYAYPGANRRVYPGEGAGRRLRVRTT